MQPDLPVDASPGVPPRDYAVDWAHRAGAVDEVLGELSRCAARQKRRRFMFAGSTVVILLVAGLVLRPSWPFRTAPTSSTIVLMPAQRVLPDGTVVELKDGAEISVGYTNESIGPRRVTLQRGEAHFAVAKNKARPFIVTAGGIEFRAVGTAFSVELGTKQVELVVTEGRVAVNHPSSSGESGTGSGSGLDSGPQTIATVDAGSRVVVPVQLVLDSPLAAGPVEAVSPAEMTERMAWRVPKLEFSGTPLAEAVAMFNQHNDVKFVLADSALGELQVSGFLRADKTETFVLLLETDFGLKAERRNPKEILLRRP